MNRWEWVKRSLEDLFKSEPPHDIGPHNVIGLIGRASMDGTLGESLQKAQKPYLLEAKSIALDLGMDLVSNPGEAKKEIEARASDLEIVKAAGNALTQELRRRNHVS